MLNCCLLAADDYASKKLFEGLTAELPDNIWTYIHSKENIDEYGFEQFDYVFVLRWPFIISKEVLSQSNFIGFHTSNLPHGRGGSPLQNQIMCGILETRVNALQLVSGIDTGPVYDSQNITIQGSINDVWLTIARIAKTMIIKILDNEITPIKQTELDLPIYKRRKDNSINNNKFEIKSLLDLHRFIQMLDGDGYPSAFLKIANFKIELTRSAFNGEHILCDAKIIMGKK